MKGILVRVASDQSTGGGNWNGPVDLLTRRFAYVPIPERKACRAGLETPYGALVPALARFRQGLPEHLAGSSMHLDPDFLYLSYGDRGAKGRQLSHYLGSGDFIVFYASLRDIATRTLSYAIIGLFVVDRIIAAGDVPECEWARNAHTRRTPGTDDVIVLGRESESGRLSKCIPIGEYRARAYRVRQDLLDAWGGISANDGYLQRSAVFPRLSNPKLFLTWWKSQVVKLVRENNPQESEKDLFADV